jgi:hypothetical protein
MNKENIKPFHTQFCECKKENLVGHTKPLKYKNHPQLCPLPFSAAGRELARVLEKDPNHTFQLCRCLRFKGVCGSHNKKCKKLRGL